MQYWFSFCSAAILLPFPVLHSSAVVLIMDPLISINDGAKDGGAGSLLSSNSSQHPVSRSTEKKSSWKDKVSTVADIAIDMMFFRPSNTTKLITHEESHFFHIHKIMGVMVLSHYFYRTYLLVTTGSMQFDSSLFTPYCIILHMLLSGSSFIFKISQTRIQSAPMIYPEFRLHSILFAYRSLVVMLLMWYAKRYNVVLPLYFRGVVVLVTMVLADMVTNHYKVRTKNQGTTMRTMPFPDYLNAPFRERLNTFYSVCQIFATCQVIYLCR